MNIQWQTISTNFQGEHCFVHARGTMTPEGKFIITT